MVFAKNARQPPAFSDQVRAQVGKSGERINFIFRIACLFTLIEISHLPRVIGDIQITVFIAIINTAVAAVNL